MLQSGLEKRDYCSPKHGALMQARSNLKSRLKMYRFKREKELILEEDFDATKASLMEAIAVEEIASSKILAKFIELFISRKRFADALELISASLKKSSKNSHLLWLRAYCYAQGGDLSKAIENASLSLEISPNQAVVSLNLAVWKSRLATDGLQIKNFFEEHSRKHLDNLIDKAEPLDINEYKNNKKIRIGYVSGDLKNHSVRYFIEPFLRFYSRSDFEVHAFMTMQPDDISNILGGLVDKWHDVRDLPDSELLELIRRERIHILVDLSGHTEGSRLEVFAMRAAPVQVTWFGFMQTLGMQAIDYRFSDHSVTPEDSDKFYTEKLYRLKCMASYMPPVNADVIHSMPFNENGFMTMVSLNEPRKINDEVLEVWQRLHSSRGDVGLIIISHEHDKEAAINQLEPKLRRHNFDRSRVLVHPRMTMREFLGISSVADFALDTFPVSGGTVTLHSLWIGLPTLTLKNTGDTAANNSAASTMSGVGMNECVASSPEEYLSVGLDWLNNPGLVEELRRSCRPMLQASELMDYRARISEVESAYQKMWQERIETS